MDTHLNTVRKKIILLAGLNLRNFDITAKEAVDEWERRSAVPFDLEATITNGVYTNIRQVGSDYLDRVEKKSREFIEFSTKFIQKNPYFLPIFQHLSGIFSKAALKKHVGSVSDNAILAKGAARVSAFFKNRIDPTTVNKKRFFKDLN